MIATNSVGEATGDELQKPIDVGNGLRESSRRLGQQEQALGLSLVVHGAR